MSIRPLREVSSIDPKSRALVDETVALRRCALFRDAFKGTAVSYPAALLGFDTLAAWVRRHGVTVDATSAVELEGAMAEGIDPMRIVMYPHDGNAAPIRRAVNAGAARFIVGSCKQISFLANSADRVQRVVIDATNSATDTMASEVLAHRGLELIGLHCRLDGPDDALGMVKLREMIAEMAGIRREHGVLLSRVSLAGLDVGERCLEPRILRRIAESMGEVIGDACARYGCPRPGLTLAPVGSALLPA
jgi:diaminopimelate decarboxylase